MSPIIPYLADARQGGTRRERTPCGSGRNPPGSRKEGARGSFRSGAVYAPRGSSRRWGTRRETPDAASAAQAETLAAIRSSVRPARGPSRAHCHTIIRFHPAARQAASLRRSRRTFFDHFSIQKATFVFGMVDSRHPCRCQKHPRTSTIVFARGITTSGLPGYRLSQTLNRQPSANSLLRTRSSGILTNVKYAKSTSERSTILPNHQLIRFLQEFRRNWAIQSPGDIHRSAAFMLYIARRSKISIGPRATGHTV